RRSERLGRSRSARKRLGVDIDRLRWFCGLPSDGDLSRLFDRLLRWEALRPEGGLTGHGEGAPAPQLPKLVPGELSICVCDVPDGEVTAMAIEINAAAPPAEAVVDFAADVRRDLALSPKQIQSKYLYNALGSCLFEAISRLPWYRITRAEGRLLSRWAESMVSSLSDPLTFIELGCGSGEKVAMLAEALRSRRRSVSVHLIDISPVALELSDRTLGRLEHVSCGGHPPSYEDGLRQAAK